jgi:hypothetical protein
MPKTFNSGDVLSASDLNTNMVQPGTAGTGVRIVAGTTSFTMSAEISKQVTVSYGFTFSAAPTVVGTVRTNSNIPLICFHNGAPGVSSATMAVWDSNNNAETGSFAIHWVAIGPA